MAPKPIATLKSQMPIGVTGSISAQDIHDIVDTVEARTTGRVLAKTGNYTATADDDGATLVFTSSSTSTLTLPASLPAGWRCDVFQADIGQVGISVLGGFLRHPGNHTFTDAQYALAHLLVFANDGSAPQVAFGGDTTDLNTTTRFDISTIDDVWGAWDSSDTATRTPSSGTLITALADRSAYDADLTAAAVGGGSVAAVLSNPAYIQTFGGNGQRRLDAPAGKADNMFLSGGTLVAVVRAAAPTGVLAAKFNTNGWILWADTTSTLRFEWYQGAQFGSFTFPFPASATDWVLLEIEWDSEAANTAGVARVNGEAVGVSIIASGYASVDDSAATLVVGNRNWGTLSTPWSGDIGEILLLAGTPTEQQMTDLRADLIDHWSIPEEEEMPLIDLSEWTLVFDEDFNAPLSRRVPGDASTSSNRWSTSMGDGSVRWMGNPPERQIYVEPEYAGTKGTPLGINPFSVADSVLTITCNPVTQADAPYLSGKEYTSGLITTQQSYTQLYGYFEMRAQLPTGMGSWPAFWLLFHDTVGSEFDIVECYGIDSSMAHQTVHQASGAQGYPTPLDWSNGWHTYGVKWDVQRIIFYIDGIPRASHINTTNTPAYIIANLALEGRLDRAPDSSTIFPLQMKIDYIRGYQPNS